MARRAVAPLSLLLCWLAAQAGLAAGLSKARDPPPVAGARRDIQYLVHKEGGISDRIALFTFLAELGAMHNATVRLRDFEAGPPRYLTRMHSKNVSGRWDRYFDTSADGGNPWHAALELQGCSSVVRRDTDFSRLFDDGATCVDLFENMYHFHQWKQVIARAPARIRPSREVDEAADRVARAHDLTAGYGAVHVRRCDRLQENRGCTSPESVARALERFPSISRWVVFSCAEEGYSELLRGAITKPGRTLAFEDELPLNPDKDGDNYFTFMVSREIFNRAQVKVDTQLCHGAPDPHVVEDFRSRRAAAWDVALADVEFGSLCGGAPA